MELENQCINTEITQNPIHSYWIFNKAINKEICQQIIDLGKNKWLKAKVQTQSLDKEFVDTKARAADVVWSDNEDIYRICWNHVLTANKNANWNFKISACEPMQITRYKKNGHYDFHFDGNGFTRKHKPEDELLHGTARKLSMSIILNQDYEGGEFEFLEDGSSIKAETGTIIVFPSYMMHRVKPITKGIRYSLVAWFSGEPFR